MGRHRTAEIQESLNRLYELEKGLEKSLDVKRVRMLRLLKENPRQSLADVAAAIGQGCSTVERWWGEYLSGGINQLLKIGTRGGNRASRLNQQQLKSLAARVERGDLTTYPQMQGWINREFDQNYSIEGVRYLVTTKIGREQKNGVQKTTNKRQVPDASLLNDRFLQFLNTLPIAGDSDHWVQEFKRM
jgi:transposase